RDRPPLFGKPDQRRDPGASLGQRDAAARADRPPHAGAQGPSLLAPARERMARGRRGLRAVHAGFRQSAAKARKTGDRRTATLRQPFGAEAMSLPRLATAAALAAILTAPALSGERPNETPLSMVKALHT